MGARGNRSDIDESLLVHVAALPRAGQRWLRTALYAITTIDLPGEADEREPRRPKRAAPEAPPPPQADQEPTAGRGPTFDQAISGEVDLREEAENYPELSEELEGLADIIDMLRAAGRERRRRGEEILRKEILGEPDDDVEAEDEDGDTGEQAG